MYVDSVFCQAKSFPRQRSLEREAAAELVQAQLRQLGKLSLAGKAELGVCLQLCLGLPF